MSAISADLEWWRKHGDAVEHDAQTLHLLLERLKAWKVRHDEDRARQFGFLRMAWDGVFADEDQAVDEAIRQVEDALARA